MPVSRLLARAAAGLLLAAAPAAAAAAPAGATAGPGPVPETGPPQPPHVPIRATLPAPAPAPVDGYVPSRRECTTTGASDGDRGRDRDGRRDRDNLNLDCDDPTLPNNEPHIAVNPRDPKHLVASSNDYDSNATQFYTSFDRGRTWVTGNMALSGPDRVASDPVTTFDAEHDVVLHSSINYRITSDGGTDDGDIVVSRSTDGGRTWQRPVEVYSGQGAATGPVQVFNDKEWMVTDNGRSSPFFGRTYVTWSRFLVRGGKTVESPIWLSHSDDGGRTWAAAREISGSSRTCVQQEDGPPGECDQSHYSVSAVAPDGTLYVALQNEQHQTAWEPGERFETQYLVVRSTDGGRTFTDPVSVVDLEDGTRDYPMNPDERPTLTGFQARINSAGNITVNPVTGEVVLVFADNRSGRRDVDRPVTDTNVYLMRSKDRGRTWRGPRPVAADNGDQWFPWIAVNPKTGRYGVVYHDEVGNGRYVTAYAVERGDGFRRERVATEVSNARDSLFFRAKTPDCPQCSLFFGDYISLAYGRDGSAHVVWTDMRREARFRGGEGHTENIFYVRR